jgi:hypothetical protein
MPRGVHKRILRTHCPRGHPYDGWRKNGRWTVQYCKMCQKIGKVYDSRFEYDEMMKAQNDART